MLRRVMFRKIVTMIFGAPLPIDLNLLLKRFIPKPMITHVPGFGAFLAHIGVDKRMSSRIVGF